MSFLDDKGLSTYTKKLESVFTIGDQFSLVLPSEAWNNNICNIESEKILSGDEYSYIVCPNELTLNEYARCGVRMLDPSTDGYAVFKADSVPESNLLVNLLQLKI